MDLLFLAFAVVVVLVVAVVGLVYWHESRRPEVRARDGGADRSAPSAADADGDRPARGGSG